MWSDACILGVVPSLSVFLLANNSVDSLGAVMLLFLLLWLILASVSFFFIYAFLGDDLYHKDVHPEKSFAKRFIGRN